MAFDDFISGFSNTELDELASRIRQNEISASREADLRELLEDVAMARRQEAFDSKPAIVDVLVALDLEFEFPNGDAGFLEDGEEEEIENGLEIDEQPAPEPEEPEFTVDERPRQPPGERQFEGRPDPRVGSGDLALRFPSPYPRDDFVSLETARRNFNEQNDRDMNPGTFFDQFAQEVLGRRFVITREGFVQAEQSPRTTGEGF